MAITRRQLLLVAEAVGAAVVLLLAIAWLSGAFHHKVEPGRTPAAARGEGSPVAAVELRQTTVVRRAVGTVRAIHETAVSSRLLARVNRVAVTAGQKVERDQLLVELDKADIEAQVRQADADREAAKAVLEKASSDLKKLTELHASQAASDHELRTARSAFDVARSKLAAAEQRLEEMKVQLRYATILSPIKGIVVDKLVEEGDLARPGQTLARLYEPDRLQLVASVPERLAVGLKVGDEVGVEIEAIDLTCKARIHEIVPEAEALSRAFSVKVTGPCPPGVYSGMFGRLLIEEGLQERLLIPIGAVRRVGQLELVQVVDASGQRSRRYVRTGERSGEMVEVLSGLSAGERVTADFGT